MPVVIKVLRNDIAMDPEFFNQFKEDALKIVQLSHENIVTVFDITGLYRTIFLFSEFLEGKLLRDTLDNAPQQSWPLNRAIDLLLQICSGLGYAHEKGLIHKGISPNNIFLLQNDQVKIVDFGLAYPKGFIGVSLGERVKYMSPEQIKGEILDERADIYSLGVTAFEMITGQQPFVNYDVKNFLDLCAGSGAGPEIQDVRSLNPDLPEAIYQFILQATKKNPDERYRSVSEIITLLTPFAGI